ncbi:MAG: cell division protein SepF [Armatimonadetes bacterium]|nr:cell division protein SepF [Armatimonadota bacterium]
MRAAPQEEYDDLQRTVWEKFKDKIGLGDYEEDEVDFIDEPSGRRRTTTVRVHSSRPTFVSVWLTIQSFENAQQAADGLKSGHQQIVNLEKATPEVCVKVIDFLSGVIYALDGYIEKVGDKVYLFTPANYVIEVENGGNGNRKVNAGFHDN